MECGICTRPYTKSRKPTCVSCAQARLYDVRLQQAITLIDRENAHTRAEAIVRPGNDGVLAALPPDADWDTITDGVKQHGTRRMRDEQERVTASTEVTSEQLSNLRERIEELKAYASEKRRENHKRKEEIKAERKDLEKRKLQALDPLEATVRKAHQRIERVHNKTVDARAFICNQTSLLVGLCEVRDGRGRSTGRYALNGLMLPNLKELHTRPDSLEDSTSSSPSRTFQVEHHETINACLDNICRLVRLWCHYLSVRLPAETVLPHNDFPHSAILSERSSYKIPKLPYPGTLGNQVKSPAASRLLPDPRTLPRPRLLHLDRPLPQLMKEDNKAFGLFLEGVLLLAWDVAWLCRTQGIANINTFNDVCNIGKNLFLLSKAQESSSSGRPSLNRINTSATDATSRSRRPGTATRFGSFSHGNLQHSLAGHEGAALLHDWHMAQPSRLVDKLRQYMLTEITGEEWDVLSEGDYDEQRKDEVAVLVGGARMQPMESKHPAMSIMSVAPAEDQEAQKKGESGWMKVRGRGGNA